MYSPSSTSTASSSSITGSTTELNDALLVQQTSTTDSSCLKQFNVHGHQRATETEAADDVVRKRCRSNRKERRRNEEMNIAYACLQRCVPHIPSDQRLPKIKTLRLALRYIQHLQNVLNGSQFHGTFSNEVRPLQLEDFASVAMAEVQARNNYKDRAAREAQMGIPTEDICRKSCRKDYAVRGNVVF
uniref:BHLH domain-containing protein n=1 Tax=Syphacia muris TaxID=451379 RepID=A0A0N5ATM7_9BILA